MLVTPKILVSQKTIVVEKQEESSCKGWVEVRKDPQDLRFVIPNIEY